MKFINNQSDHIKSYLDNHKIESVNGFATFNTLKSAIIGSFSQVTRYKDDYYYCGIDTLEIMLP